MTTPPTTAGWYPDPDGSGGQRYWDGAAWTAQRPDGPEATEETSAWPAELPPWPEDDMAMPSWEDAGKADPVVEDVEQAVVEPADAVADVAAETVDEPATESGGAESGAAEPVAAEDATPDVDDTDQATAVVQLTEQPTAVVDLPSTTPEQPTAVVNFAGSTPEQPTATVPTLPPPPAFATASPVQPTESAGSPLKGYLIGVAGLLIVLVGVLVWAFVFADPGRGTTEASGADAATEASVSAAPTTDSADPETTDAPAVAATGEAIDGVVTITTNGVEITPTVTAVDNDFLTKSAAGQFVVVTLNLVNNGETPATFLSDQQVLTAGGQTFTPDTEGTFYLGGISAVLYPGEPVDMTIAFDVPAGSTPESLQVFGDLGSAGATIALA